jgi:hypothetical protein
MEMAEKEMTTVPGWAQKLFAISWYTWFAGITEAALLLVFLLVTYTQFAQGEPRAGWVMILLTIVVAAPGIWMLFGYRPQIGSKLGLPDYALFLCFAIWVVLFGYLMFWGFQLYSGPYGSPHLTN